MNTYVWGSSCYDIMSSRCRCRCMLVRLGYGRVKLRLRLRITFRHEERLESCNLY